MKTLYNCETEEEIKLKETILEELKLMEILNLASDIKDKFYDGILEDENIVVDSMMKIILELVGRANK